MATAVNNTSSTTSSAFATANASTQNLIDDTQDRFLTLLVTQLQNQDPLNPMDNADVTSQIAQLSTVNGITQLNNTLLALSGQVDVSQSMQAASLIGRGVLIPGEKISLGTGEDGTRESTPFGVDVVAPATSVTVTIKNSSGVAVRKLDLGAQEVGVYSVEWDGKDDNGTAVPDGAYTIEVAARGGEGDDTSTVLAEGLTYGRVDSLAYTAEGLRLDMGLAGRHSLMDVRKVM